ncbi:MAG: hypothetical protein IJ139_03635 [Bacteroidaceae bacterium]|nr:hypothetical protein [Bacteroidaceae bacterium]MBQ8675724.1 hypothetical protein [Bacteroidaceae bacterium]MBQ9175942.1 hypothetical protein [Bacteroidaceae bacterium]MBR1378078.1 hypothetical protein [Bacteroidaceae bacterium]
MRIIALILTLLPLVGLRAQELEYKMELGGMLGANFYLGDANYSALYKNTNAAFGAMARYNFNPRMAMKFNLAATKISGNALDGPTRFPEAPAEQKWKFSNTLVDLSCQYELHAWAYGTGQGFKGTRRLTPYIQMGLGFTYAGNTLTMNIPIGIGLKYKLKERWNCGVDWSMRLSMSDKLDGISDPYNIKGGFLKNKDSYSMTMFYISYDLFPKYRECNND